MVSLRILLCSLFLAHIAIPGIAQEAPIIGEAPAISYHLDQESIRNGEVRIDDIISHGRTLFTSKFNRLDGLGRPLSTGSGAPRAEGSPLLTRISGPLATSCTGCHLNPYPGGAGEIVVNVFEGAQYLDPVTFYVTPLLSNERNTLGLHGSGPIEMLAREMSIILIEIRETARKEAMARVRKGESPESVKIRKKLIAKGIHFGFMTMRGDGKINPSEIEGIDWDLVVKPFMQKGTVVSLRQMADQSMLQHMGIQSVDRFGAATDPDGDGITDELTTGDLTALTIYLAALGTPAPVLSDDPAERALSDKGSVLFNVIGCSRCHIDSLRLDDRLYREPNPYNPTPNSVENIDVVIFDMTAVGSQPRIERDNDGALVRAFTDLKRHSLVDCDLHHFGNEQIEEGMLFGTADPGDFYAIPEQIARPTDQFITRKLWDVGSSMPYGHRGDLTTLSEAIHFHGGEGRTSRNAYFALPPGDRAAILAFLRSQRATSVPVQ